MGRSTRRHKKEEKGVMTIPQLRRAFEHIEGAVSRVRGTTLTREGKIRSIRQEWQRVFSKSLPHASAAALLDEPAPRKTRKRGGALSGAPLDYTTRAGVYLAPQSIPDAEGGLPLSGMPGKTHGGAYGSYVSYVQHGFFNPEPSISYDPVVGQSEWPAPAADMGSNRVQGGRRTRRRLRRGGGLMGQALDHPVSASSPPNPLQDAQDLWKGRLVDSPDPTQQPLSYRTPE